MRLEGLVNAAIGRGNLPEENRLMASTFASDIALVEEEVEKREIDAHNIGEIAAHAQGAALVGLRGYLGMIRRDLEKRIGGR